MLFKNINNFRGVNWLKNGTTGTGAQAMVISSAPDDNIIISSVNKWYNRCYADITPAAILNLINYDINLCEIITHEKHKIYFDIDANTSEIEQKDNFLSSILADINLLFPSSDVAVSGSETNYKYSYHITLNNYLCIDKIDKDILKQIVKYLKIKHSSFDDVVYKKNQQMKTIKQSKFNDKSGYTRIQNIIINDDPKKHIITAFFNDIFIKLSDVNFNDDVKAFLHIEHINAPFNISKMPKIKQITTNVQSDKKFTFEDIESLTAYDILNLCPLSNTGTFNHSYTFKIFVYSFFNKLTIDEYLSWYSQKTTDPAKIYNKTKCYNIDFMSKYITPSNETMIKMLSFYYPDLRKFQELQKINNLLNISKYKDIMQYSDVITPLMYASKQKNILFNYGMGAGKTTETINYIQQRLKDDAKLKILFITPNITLSRGVYYRLNKQGLNFEHYDIDYTTTATKKTKQKADIKTSQKLVICINSLHHLSDNKFDIVVCDEIETTLNKWYDNKTLNEHQVKSINSWYKFTELFEQSQQNIFLDAFTTNLTIEFINSISKNNDTIIYQRVIEHSQKQIVNIKKFNNWLQLIIDKLNSNKKVFIFYPFKNGNNTKYAMSKLFDVIEQKTNKQGIMYNADVAGITIKKLDNVEAEWSKADFILTNSKITVGINYELNDFDSVFLSVAGFSSVRDVIQSSARLRNINSNLIYTHFLDAFNTVKTFSPDCSLLDNCNIYNKLIKNIKVEKLAPLKTTFYKLCKIAGYKINNNIITDEINNSIMDNIKDILQNDNFKININNIKDITNKEAKHIQNKILQNATTYDENLQLNKYFFLKKFNEDILIKAAIKLKHEDDIFLDDTETTETQENNIYSDEIEFMYNKNYLNFIDGVKKLLKDDDNVFKKIQTYNNNASIFPDDENITKLKFDDDIYDTIFGEVDKPKIKPKLQDDDILKEQDDKIIKWTFKDLKRTSKTHLIYRDMLEKTFNKQLIISKNKNNHLTFSISENNKNLYQYCIQHLRQDPKKPTTETDNLLDININAE